MDHLTYSSSQPYIKLIQFKFIDNDDDNLRTEVNILYIVKIYVCMTPAVMNITHKHSSTVCIFFCFCFPKNQTSFPKKIKNKNGKPKRIQWIMYENFLFALFFSFHWKFEWMDLHIQMNRRHYIH